MLKRKDLLGLMDVSGEEIMEILLAAREMKRIFDLEVKKSDILRGKSVCTLFYENSTRTRTSFETAAKMLGASTAGVAASTSSIQKGETLIDTGKTLDALMTDVIVIRHNMAGAPHLLARNVKAHVVNGGDGRNEHPTQALLDMLTIYNRFNNFKGLKVVIAGDVKHSRVARSNLWGLNKLGAEVTLVAPATLLPAEVERMGCHVSYDLDEAIEGANVVMGLRLQLERQQAALFPGGEEYHRYYGLTARRVSHADSNAIVLHPGPVNRRLELSSEVADGENSFILEQVNNGVAVRMAVLDLLTRS